MSTYLDFHCRVCKQNAGLTLSRVAVHQDGFVRMLDLQKQIAELKPVASTLFRNSEFGALPVFFEDHGRPGHDIVLVNGYGQWWLVDQKRWTSVALWEMDSEG